MGPAAPGNACGSFGFFRSEDEWWWAQGNETGLEWLLAQLGRALGEV